MRLRASVIVAALVAIAVLWTGRAASQMPDPLLGSQWHLKARTLEPAGANVVNIWPAHRGNGVVVGVVDDGLQHTHPDLQGNYIAALSYDFNDDDPDPDPGFDVHGTPAAGIAGAVGDNGIGVSGVAPGASLAGMRLIAAPTSDADVASALAHQPAGIHILSNSWGPSDNGISISGPGPMSQAAIESAATAGRAGLGRVFVWAGGNGRQFFDNCNFDGYANNRFVIAVGAVADDGKQAWYSEPCSALFVSAPSSGGLRGITTTDLEGDFGSAIGDYTSTFGGTSAATPVVSGVVALMLSANPGLTGRDVHHILRQTSARIDLADPTWTAGPFPHSENYGFGLVDAVAAVTAAANWTNVGSEVSTERVAQNVGVALPDANPNGLTSTIAFDSSFSSFSIERIEVDVSVAHARRGDLDIQLISPAGVVSRLATPRSDPFTNLNWRFSSVRHWGELAAGTWTLRVADVAPENTGTWNSWSLRVYGTQNGQPCTYQLTPTSASFASGGGQGTVNMNATPGCPWTAAASVPWITIDGGASGNGPGTISYTVSANASALARSGAIHAGGKSHGITQSGVSVNSVTVLSPNGGERLFTGTPYTISWTIAEPDPITSFNVFFAPDGTSFSPVVGCGSLDAAARSCVWTAPGLATAAGRIKVVAVGIAGSELADISDAAFKIVGGAAFVDVKQPSTAAEWGIGSTQTIKWDHNLGPGSFVRIESSRDGGPWQVLAASHPNSKGTSGTFNWMVEGPPSNSVVFRVAWTGGPASDVTPAVTIFPPALNLIAPAAGANWGFDAAQSIRWKSNLGPGDSIQVEVSWDDGGSWTLIGLVPDTGSMEWRASAPGATSRARIRGRWKENLAVGDISARFAIRPPFVQVIKPDGSPDWWASGSTAKIKWQHNLGNLEKVRIELSTNGGQSYDVVLFASTPSDGAQPLTVLPAWQTERARIRIVWTRHDVVADQSRAFVIQ